jgi:hypothetical protein
VEDLDRQVLALLAEELLALLTENHAGPVVRIHDVVANVEVLALQQFDVEIGVSRLFN